MPLSFSTPPRGRLGLVAAMAAAAVMASACSSTSVSVSPEEMGLENPPLVVASIEPIADLVLRVGTGRISVTTLVTGEQDSHTYAPRPSDVRLLADADMFFDNGLGLNLAVEELATENLAAGTPWVRLGNMVSPTKLIEMETDCHEDHCHGSTVNPHMWLSPALAMDFTRLIKDQLTAADPAGAATYAANADALLIELSDLDAAIEAAVATIPEDNRVLVVYHDAWVYFAQRYGLRMVGAVQPQDFSQPSAAEVAQIIEQLEFFDVPAFFGSKVFPTDVLETISSETGASYVGDLSDDSLPGEPGSMDHSYLELMRQNAITIVENLGGDPSALEAA